MIVKHQTIHVIHILPDTNSDRVHRQFEMAYQLVLQSRQSPDINICYSNSASPHPHFLSPHYPLAAPARTVISLLLQLTKATVLAVFYPFSLYSLCSTAVCSHVSGRSNLIYNFYHFIFPGFHFTFIGNKYFIYLCDNVITLTFDCVVGRTSYCILRMIWIIKADLKIEHQIRHQLFYFH